MLLVGANSQHQIWAPYGWLYSAGLLQVERLLAAPPTQVWTKMRVNMWQYVTIFERCVWHDFVCVRLWYHLCFCYRVCESVGWSSKTQWNKIRLICYSILNIKNWSWSFSNELYSASTSIQRNPTCVGLEMSQFRKNTLEEEKTTEISRRNLLRRIVK